MSAETNGTVVSYKISDTPVVSDIVPSYGTVIGNEKIRIEGEHFGSNKDVVEVVIDGVTCVISSVSDKLIVCLTGRKYIKQYLKNLLILFKIKIEKSLLNHHCRLKLIIIKLP